jgi:sugar lactone lactonase YvrE
MNVLYVTSARLCMSDDQLASAPQSGALFQQPLDFRGLPESRFRIR